MTRRLSITIMPKSAKSRFLGLKRRLSKISDRSLATDDNKSLHEETSPASTASLSTTFVEPQALVVDIVEEDSPQPRDNDDDDDDDDIVTTINSTQENETTSLLIHPPPSPTKNDEAIIIESESLIENEYCPNDLATKAAEEKKASVRNSLPPSLLLYADDRDCIAPFRRDEVVLGPLLGSGEFSHVYEVQSFRLFATPKPSKPLSDDDDDLGSVASVSINTEFTKEELKKRAYMKKCEKYQQTENARYALKHIKGEYLKEAIETNDVDSYVQAACDLSSEAEILAALNHPNIIKLRGMTHSASPDGGGGGFSQGPCGYFLIIDRLFETLDQRIQRWSTAEEEDVGIDECKDECNGQHSLNKADGKFGMSDELLDERLSVALQISAAMIYLHSHSIIFRDLKPANIGFDVRGDVKIFDFGLARIMPDNGRHYDDTYKMSGAGSPRFMAPECLCGESYNMKADVYSFAIVFWGMLAGDTTPYAFAKTMYQLADYVVNKDGRPNIHERWPTNIKQILERCFDGDMERRPEMTVVHRDIKSALASLRGGNRKGLSESYIVRRRSFESFQLNSFIASELDLSKIVLNL